MSGKTKHINNHNYGNNNLEGSPQNLKKSAASNNRNGFQEVSAPGPRRGTGGFENSPAKKSCSPITQRSKSPLKMNAALVAGAGQIGKKFVDVGA